MQRAAAIQSWSQLMHRSLDNLMSVSEFQRMRPVEESRFSHIGPSDEHYFRQSVNRGLHQPLQSTLPSSSRASQLAHLFLLLSSVQLTHSKTEAPRQTFLHFILTIKKLGNKICTNPTGNILPASSMTFLHADYLQIHPYRSIIVT